MFEIFDSVHSMGNSYAWEQFEKDELDDAMQDVAYEMERIAQEAISPMSQSRGATGQFHNSFYTEIYGGEVSLSSDLPYGGDMYNTGNQFNKAGGGSSAPAGALMDWVDRMGFVDIPGSGKGSRYYAVANSVNAGGDISGWQEDVANQTEGLLMKVWEDYLRDNYV